ncbi:expressed unknown protein [Seminavis robusta]|uniref:Uncharacterized protein n=1 Tax=Seminavis robusta TaxID=568900 RepID=A0A9N8H6A2_9STRA|nr:expressed unknown protein [Seminavis robusta]|eukprot:Sro94_g048870.1 n/a (314) ;mRNA; f:24817-25758
MRFLLHPTTRRATAQGIRKGRPSKRSKEAVPSFAGSHSVDVSPDNNDGSKNYVQNWGQQCSPNCGCVVRFETKVDPVSNKFISASYYAKSVIVTQTSSQDQPGRTLQPALTLRTNRPMFHKCKCKSLHQLASQVTEYLPNKNALNVGSSMEFSGVRSSPAFRHTVLEKQGLSTNDTHCFDLVEEALTAMVKGHMPKQRAQVPFKEALASASATGGSAHYYSFRDEDDADDQFRIDIDMSKFLAPPRALSALNLLDVNAKYSPFGFDGAGSGDEDSRYSNKTTKPESPTKSKAYDWVTYVDELYERSEEIQKSA